jgi:hypothetical protein
MSALCRVIGLCLALALESGCGDDGTNGPRSGTETNVQGVPCTSDLQCGEELRCLPVADAADGGMVCQKPPL